MDGVHQHFEPRHAFEERPVLPRRVQIQPHLDVRHVAQHAADERVSQCQHVRREPQLEVHGGDELPLATDRADAACVVEVAAHRLLHQHRRAGRQAFEDAGDVLRRYCDVEHRSGRRERIVERCEDAWDAARRRALAGGSQIDVEDAGDWEAEPRVHGQMRVAHDAARADDDDRPRRGGQRPLLAQIAGRDHSVNTSSIFAHNSPGCAPGAGSCSDAISFCHSRMRGSLPM